MRRFRITLVIAAAVCLGGMTFVPGAAAGDFADAPCSGEPTKVCPVATVGQQYSVEFRLKEPGDCGPRFAVSSGAFPPGLSFATDEGVARGTPTQAGSYRFFVTVSYSCGLKSASDQEYLINVNPPVQRLIVSTQSLPDAGVGQAYSAQLSVSGGTASSWSVVQGALPDGLTLSAGGLISGTPTKGGPFTFTVQATGSPNSDTKVLGIFVLAPLEIQSLTGQKPPGGKFTAKSAVNEPLTTGVKAAGGRGPYTYAATGLPPGFTVDAATGAISGAGTVAGRYATTITATDATAAKASVEFDFTIVPLLQFAKGKGLPAGKVGRLYSARIPVSGKDAASAQFAFSGKIPPGLELDEAGRLTGALLKAGTYRIRVFAFPANSAPISQAFTIRVRP